MGFTIYDKSPGGKVSSERSQEILDQEVTGMGKGIPKEETYNGMEILHGRLG